MVKLRETYQPVALDWAMTETSRSTREVLLGEIRQFIASMLERLRPPKTAEPHDEPATIEGEPLSPAEGRAPPAFVPSEQTIFVEDQTLKRVAELREMTRQAQPQTSTGTDAAAQDSLGSELPKDYHPDQERQQWSSWEISLEHQVASLTQEISEEQSSRKQPRSLTTVEAMLALDHLREIHVVKGNMRFPGGEFYALAYAIKHREKFYALVAAAGWTTSQKVHHESTLEDYESFIANKRFPASWLTHAQVMEGPVKCNFPRQSGPKEQHTT